VRDAGSKRFAAELLLTAALILASLSVLAPSRAMADASGQQRAQQAGRALINKPAPRLVRQTIDGDTIDLGSLYGKKAVYLKFWATWCVPCRQQMPRFQHVYETEGPDLAVIAVDVGFNDSVDAIRSYRKKLGITMPVIFDDGSLASAFHVRVTPTHVVIGHNGRIQYVGHLADSQLDAALIAARTVPSRASARTASPSEGTAEPSGSARDKAVGIGDRLPPLELATLDGQAFNLAPGAKDRAATVLVFLSPWCESYLAESRPESSASCKSARTAIDGLQRVARVRWLGIASGLWADEEDLRKYREKYSVKIPLTLDASGDVFRRFRVNDVPTVLIADSSGRIVRRVGSGKLEGEAADTSVLRKAIESANKTAPAAASTQ
jgi:thiol-disulfide isomerase/thioredoxin